MFLPSNITLQFGDSGDFVAELQRRLSRVGCFNEHQVSGFYDGATVTGVSSFQSRVGLHVDGVAGPETLRRLNGVITGDTSTTSGDKKEEQAAKEAAAAAQIRQNFVAADQLAAAQLAAQAASSEVTQTTQAVPETASIPATTPEQPQPLSAAASQVTQDVIAQQAMRDQQLNQQMAQAQQAQAAPKPNLDLLAQMLLQTAPKPVPLAPEQPPRMSEMPPQAPSTLAPVAPQPTAPAPLAPEQATASAAPTAKPVAAEQATHERKGIVGRAIQAVNSYIEKLGAYFEAKLPPSVMNEVKAIGEVMAKSGMREAPIPTGPELPSRAQELPGKAPEPTQTPQRN